MTTFISPALDAADLLALARLDDDGAPPAVSSPQPADGQTSHAYIAWPTPGSRPPARRKRPGRNIATRPAGWRLRGWASVSAAHGPRAHYISFLGAHLHLSLAVALLLAAIAGALLMAAAGTARITQLRRIMRRDRRKHKQAEQPR